LKSYKTLFQGCISINLVLNVPSLTPFFTRYLEDISPPLTQYLSHPKPSGAPPLCQNAHLKLLACRRILLFLCCFFYYSADGGLEVGKWRVFPLLFNFVLFFFTALFCCISCRCIDLKFVILLCLLSFSSRFNFCSLFTLLLLFHGLGHVVVGLVG